VGLTGAHAPGATPLEPDDIVGLKPRHVATQGELDELEESNILEARLWIRRRRARKDPLDFSFALDLHRRMFGDVWEWAGTLRRRETNVGIAPDRIATQLKQLLGNTRARIEGEPANIDQIATEFHHKLVSIHPFVNGNGRHARMLTDALLEWSGSELFSWGRHALETAGPVRDAYIAALQAADRGDYAPLAEFVRS
jgi:Fic-DOC domain mobile mystery protein B